MVNEALDVGGREAAGLEDFVALDGVFSSFDKLAVFVAVLAGLLRRFSPASVPRQDLQPFASMHLLSRGWVSWSFTSLHLSRLLASSRA